MANEVIGADSVIGFSSDYNKGWSNNHNILNTMDRSEQTRDILFGQRFEAEHLRDAICATSVAVEKNGAASQLAIEKIGAANHIAIEKTGAAGLLTAEKVGAASMLAAEKIGAASQLALEKVGSANILAGFQNFSAIQLQACNNHADALAQAAQCCCETKELICAQNQQTRDLINNIERDRNATALSDAKQEILIATLSRGNGHN